MARCVQCKTPIRFWQRSLSNDSCARGSWHTACAPPWMRPVLPVAPVVPKVHQETDQTMIPGALANAAAAESGTHSPG